MTSSLPADLLEDLRNDCVLPVVGYGYPDYVPHPVAETPELVDGVEEWIGLLGPHVWPLFHALACLPVNFILSLTPDPTLAHILEYYDPTWLMLTTQQPDYPSGRRIILPLAGSLDSPQSVLGPGTDVLEMPLDREILWSLAESFAARSRLLVIGIDPADEMSLRLLARLQPAASMRKRGWLTCGDITPRDREAWEARGFSVVCLPPAQLLRDIARTANTDLAPAPHRKLTSAHALPYKHLRYFERNESTIFFGRSVETRRLCDLVFGHRLVIVTGPSGSGKTSLVNAGLLAAVDRITGHIGIYARVEDDPVASIREAVATAMSVRRLATDKALSFAEFLAQARWQRGVVPVIVLDQAEELFTRIGTDLQEELFLTIRSCLTATNLAARFVLSLRDDYLSKCTEVRNTLPSILNNVFMVTELTRESAQAAVQLPAETAGVAFEAALAEQILDEIGLTTFSLPQLQIICTRLFEEQRDGSIDRALYESIGGAKKILRHFLAQELERLGDRAATARQILKSMVTAEGTKDLLSLQTIARRANLPEKQVEKVLVHLRDHSRLLRGVLLKDGPRYELTHEYLTTEIWSWMSELDLKRREIEDLMDRELRSWRRFKHLRLGVDRLKVFEAHPIMVATDQEALTVLLLSSLKHRGQAEIWIKRIVMLPAATQDRIARQLFDYFHNRDRLQRREAAEAIAALDPACLLRALSSTSAFQKNAALEMLGGIELQEAAPHIVELLEDPDQQTRVLACGALGEIQGEVAVGALKSAAEGEDMIVAEAAIRALGRTDSPKATAVIQDALSSQTTSIMKAAAAALAASRHPLHVQDLLLDPSVGARARQAIWDAVKQSPHTLIPHICNILDKLPNAILQEAGQSTHLNLKHAALSRLSQRSGKAATKASQQLSKEFSSWNERAEAEAKKQVAALLVETVDLQLLSEKFNENYFCREAVKRLADGSQQMGRLIERLLKSGDKRLRIEAFRAVYSSWSAFEIPERIMLEGLADSDPTVRYFACLAASRQTDPALTDIISGLTDDSAIANRHLSHYGFIEGVLGKIGECVSHAAHYALDHLNPRSKVWRKPFHRTFRGGEG